MYPVIDSTTRTGKSAYAVVDGLTRKIRAGYGVVGGVTKQFFASGAKFVSYTGDYTESSVEIDGAAYTLYTLTSSGTLTIEGDGALFWMCGSGAGGQNGSNTTGDFHSGMGGGAGYISQGVLTGGEYAVVIGAGGKANSNGNQSKIGEIVANGGKKDGSGGSGGGGGHELNTSTTSNGITAKDGGTGQGIECVPFGLSSLGEHCDGGGGGGARHDRYTTNKRAATGGAGGSNGSNGRKGKVTTDTVGIETTAGGTGGTGGKKGGGTGGGAVGSIDATPATFYGSGGGGGYASRTQNTTSSGNGSAGYQGVLYIAIPA